MRHARCAMFAALALIAVLAGCDSEQSGSIKVGFIVAGERPTYLRPPSWQWTKSTRRAGCWARLSNW